MKVRVRVFGHLRRFLPENREDLVMEIPEGTSVKQFTASRSIPDDEIWVVTINGKNADEDAVLSDGDELCLFSPVGGG